MCRGSDVFSLIWDFIWDFMDRIDQDEARRCCCKSIVDLLTGRTKSLCLREIRHDIMPGGPRPVDHASNEERPERVPLRFCGTWECHWPREGCMMGYSVGRGVTGGVACCGLLCFRVGEFGEFCTSSCSRENRQCRRPRTRRPNFK